MNETEKEKENEREREREREKRLAEGDKGIISFFMVGLLKLSMVSRDGQS